MLRCGLTYDLRQDYLAMGYGEEATAEFDSPRTIEGLETALCALGFAVERIGHVKALAARLVAGERWDFIFNICEGVAGLGREAQVPCLLDAYAIPYVFSDPLTNALTLDKAMAKKVLLHDGVPTAPFALIAHPSEAAAVTLPFPVFAKPVAEGSGKGVGPASLVRSPADLEKVAAALIAEFRQPVLVEAYLPGREFTVGITGEGAAARAIGVMEVIEDDEVTEGGYGYDNKQNWEGKIGFELVDDAEARAARHRRPVIAPDHAAQNVHRRVGAHQLVAALPVELASDGRSYPRQRTFHKMHYFAAHFLHVGHFPGLIARRQRAFIVGLAATAGVKRRPV